MLPACFCTARSVTNSVSAMAALLRPAAVKQVAQATMAACEATMMIGKLAMMYARPRHPARSRKHEISHPRKPGRRANRGGAATGQRRKILLSQRKTAPQIRPE
jgi:hypothetical protein